MAKILYDRELKKFKNEFKLKGNKVIIFLDEKYKIASYIVDAGDKIITDYEKILKYYKS